MGPISLRPQTGSGSWGGNNVPGFLVLARCLERSTTREPRGCGSLPQTGVRIPATIVSGERIVDGVMVEDKGSRNGVVLCDTLPLPFSRRNGF